MRWTRIVAVFMGLAIFMPHVAEAAQMTWRLRSWDKYATNVTFYSKNRNAAWPGGSEVYVIRDFETKSFTISCYAGEKICYGAWTRGSGREYWGAGKGGKKGCKACCYTCEDEFETPVINLND
jgi:hypothetical protein